LQSCTIGGNVAENAGGPRAFKYGTTKNKNYVLEIEAVIKNGERIRIGKRTKKWVVGYDFPSLFVGSEGTFGIITEITLRLIPKPPRFYTLLVAFGDGVKAGKSVSEMIKSSLFPTAIEFVDGKCISAVGEKIAPFLPKDTEAFLYGKCSLRRMKGQDRGFGPQEGGFYLPLSLWESS
jgi:FAD/FMN-containing dehydrogenase